MRGHKIKLRVNKNKRATQMGVRDNHKS